MRARALAPAVALVLLAGCTLGGLAAYDVPQCNASVTSYQQDDCNHGGVPADCTQVMQCSRLTDDLREAPRCHPLPLDYDRDQDPQLGCGGDDCDDRDPRRSSRASEQCDGVDNDCNGVVDDRLPSWNGTPSVVAALPGIDPRATGRATVARSGDGNVVATVVTPPSDVDGGATAPCIRAVIDPGDVQRDACTFLADEPDASPLQPYAQRVGSGIGVAFVRAALDQPACGTTLSYYNTAGAKLTLDCLGAPVSQPSFAAYQEGTYGVVVYGDAPVTASYDCGGTKTTTLRVRWIRDVASASAGFAETAVLTVASTTPAPAALLPMPGFVLAAAVDGDGVSLWQLFAPTATESAKVVPVTRIPGMAVSLVALAATRTGANGLRTAVDDIAILGTRYGCAVFSETASIVTGTLDARGFTERRTLHVPLPSKVIPGAKVTAASLSWLEGADDEWRIAVTLDDAVYVQRATTLGPLAHPEEYGFDPGAPVWSASASVPNDAAPPIVSVAADGSATVFSPATGETVHLAISCRSP